MINLRHSRKRVPLHIAAQSYIGTESNIEGLTEHRDTYNTVDRRILQMTSAQVISNWKDEDFLPGVPENPAGLVELCDSDLAIVDGGTTPVCVVTIIIATIVILNPPPAY